MIPFLTLMAILQEKDILLTINLDNSRVEVAGDTRHSA